MEDGPWLWVPAPTWKTQTKLLAPGFGPAQLWLLTAIWGANQGIDNAGSKELEAVLEEGTRATAGFQARKEALNAGENNFS